MSTQRGIVSPGLFWYWNATPTCDGIQRQLDQFLRQGIRTVYIHPMPRDFRRQDFYEGMDVPYLSDAFFELVAFTCGEMSRRGMSLWLYDEGGWPSGTAGGGVVAADPAFGAWSLERRDGRIRPVQYLPELDYPDLMNPRATACFIGLTHERYRACLEAEFGRTVPGIFTDEPRLMGKVGTERIPWSPLLPEAFEVEHGMPLDAVAEQLFAGRPVDAEVRRVRRQYVATVSRLVTEGYYRPIRDWCDGHGLLFEGHHSGEHAFARHSEYFGDFLQQADCYHVPGVDTIWRIIFPGRTGGNFVGLAASVAWLRGDRVASSETGAVYGAGLTLEQMRWIANYQLVRGVNRINFMPALYSAQGPRRISTCADFSPRNPVWRDIDLLMRSLRRAAQFTLKGAVSPRVGMLYRTEVLDTPADEEAFDAEHERLCEAVHDQWTGLIFVGLRDLARYDLSVLVIHATLPFDEEERHALRAAAERGVRLVWTGDAAGWQAFRSALGISPEQARWLDDRAALDLRDYAPLVPARQSEGVRLLTIRCDDGNGYLFFNQNLHPVDTVFHSPGGAVQLDEYRIADDVVSHLYPPVHEDGRWRLHLEPGQVRAFCSSPGEPPPVSSWVERSSQPVDGCWAITETQVYEIEDDVHIGRTRRRANVEQLGDYSEAKPGFSGTLIYRTSFACGLPAPDERIVLDLGNVYYSCGVLVNGRNAGRRAWRPYWFDVTEAVRAGMNELRVRVTNTLANQWARREVRERDFALWENSYLTKSKPFIDESCHMGLVGPVVLRRYRPS